MSTLVVCSAFSGMGLIMTVQAAPQTFNTALPVAEDEYVFREQLLYRHASDDPGTADRNLDVTGAISVLGYGINSDLAVFVALPYLDKELDVTTPGAQRVTRGTNGIGDARVFGRYTLYQADAPGRNFRIAPFLGIEMPTGDDDDRDSPGILPAPLQSGSGSWDAFGGIVLTYQILDYEIDAQAGYKLNTRANNFEFGDEATFDASLQYRLWPDELGEGVPGVVYGVLEAHLHYQGKNESNGSKDPDSGGTSFFLSPGIQYVTRRWILETIVQIPVVQDLNGTALADDFIVRAGFRIAF